MSNFKILEAPDGDVDRTILVREGFSIAAVIFTVVWALWHRMWVVSAVLFAIFAGMQLATSILEIGGFIGSVLQTAVGLIFGFEARGLRFQSLRRAGFHDAGTISANSLEAAELQYFMMTTRPVHIASVRRSHVASDDTLGLFGTH